MFRGLATVSFYADDLAAAKRWYTELLGVEAYYAFPHDGPPAYVEFRIGDYEHELGFIDARYAPHRTAAEAAGSIVYWQVDDLQATVDKLLSLGAKEHEPIKQRGDGEGFATASFVDPFGNILGVMNNPHYLSVLAARTAG
jgi:predicted enzyme related to lactoylglutathione lyase